MNKEKIITIAMMPFILSVATIAVTVDKVKKVLKPQQKLIR